MGLTKAKCIINFLYGTWVLALSMMFSPCSGASEKGTIAVRLLVPSPMVCVGQQTLDLEAILTNASEQAVELSQDGVVHSISFERFEKATSTGSTGLLLDIKPGHWITIAPHQSVVVAFTEPITDKLFVAGGLFSARIEFGVLLKNAAQYSMFPGSIPSNKTLFLISDCKSDSTSVSSPPSPSWTAQRPPVTPLIHESDHADPPTQQ